MFLSKIIKAAISDSHRKGESNTDFTGLTLKESVQEFCGVEQHAL